MLRIAFAVSLVAACTGNGSNGSGSGGTMGPAEQVSYEPGALSSTNVQAALDEVSATAQEARDRAVYIKGPTDVDPAVAATVDATLPANGRYVITAEGVLIDPVASGHNAKCTLYVEGQTGWSSSNYFTLSGATPMHMTMALDAAGNEAFTRWGCEVDGHALFIRGATLTATEVGNVVHL